ncbi:MAG: hypothetical protein V1857_05430 [archaeon]
MNSRMTASFLLTVGLTVLVLGVFEGQLTQLWTLVNMISEACLAGMP